MGVGVHIGVHIGVPAYLVELISGVGVYINISGCPYQQSISTIVFVDITSGCLY